MWVVKRKIGQCVIAKPNNQKKGYRIALTWLLVKGDLMCVQLSVTEGVRQVSNEHEQGIHLVTPNGERIVITFRVKGTTATCVVDAPKSVLLLRGELEADWRG